MPSHTSLRDSLAFKLLAALLLTVAGVLALHALLSFRSTREQLTALIHSEARRSADLIRRATHDGMLLNRLDEVEAAMRKIAEGPGVLAIRVYDKQGTVALSAVAEEVGSQARLEERPCLGCHGQGAPVTVADDESSSLLNTASGVTVVRHLSVIDNEPGCSTAACHAHAPESAVLGVLDLEMSLAPVDAALASARRQLVLTTLLLMLITGSVAWLFVWRLVVRPVLRLSEGTQRVATGDLNTRIDVRGRHELSRLAEAFNRMTADLAVARRQVEQWSQRLEEKVIDKTSELQRAQRQVLQMEKMAYLGKLAATVAHELNNPLGGILTYARLVQRELAEQRLPEPVASELSNHLQTIQRECARLGDIVRNLLLFARRDADGKSPVDLAVVVDHSLKLVNHHLQMHGINLVTQRSVEDATIMGQAGELEQALVALLVNAVEAMSQGDSSGELVLGLHQGADGEVVLEVTDTGPGIPPEVLPRIFEPFFSTKHEVSGVGLGLAVVYGIVERHGGRIEVDSAPGQGTSFRLHLPRATGAASAGGGRRPQASQRGDET